MGSLLQTRQRTVAIDVRSAPRPDVSAFGRLLSGWHLLSLDAPTVAVLWTLFLAHAERVWLPRVTAPAMFLAVWILYAADRLLDSHGAGEVLERRHLFHLEHRHRFLAGLTVAAFLLIVLLFCLPRAEFRAESALGVLVAGWFCLIHTPRRGERRVLPKEVAVGIIFAAAVCMPTLLQMPGSTRGLWLPGLLFACICSLNCFYIRRWEQGTISDVRTHWTIAAVTRWLRPATWLVAGAGLALRSTPGMAIAFAAVGFLLLDHGRCRMNQTTLRAAADAVLLSPLLLAKWW